MRTSDPEPDARDTTVWCQCQSGFCQLFSANLCAANLPDVNLCDVNLCDVKLLRSRCLGFRLVWQRGWSKHCVDGVGGRWKVEGCKVWAGVRMEDGEGAGGRWKAAKRGWKREGCEERGGVDGRLWMGCWWKKRVRAWLWSGSSQRKFRSSNFRLYW